MSSIARLLSRSVYGPRLSLSVGRDVSARAPLDEATREARATALIGSLFEDGAVEGASSADVSTFYFRRTLNDVGGDQETLTTLAGVTWLTRARRAHLGLHPVEARVDDNGHVGTITVPLARLYDDGERVSAEVPESGAQALFLENADASLTLEGWTIESPTGHLSVPVRDPGQSAKMM